MCSATHKVRHPNRLDGYGDALRVDSGNWQTIANNMDRKGAQDNERVWLIEIHYQSHMCPKEEVHHDSDPPDGR